MNRFYALLFIAILALPTSAGAADIWIFRGLLGHIYSTGLDDLGERLKRNGHRVHVLAHFGSNSALAEIIKRKNSVTLIGHSMGGKTAIKLARELAVHGIEVCLLATIDPVGSGVLPINVHVALNWWHGRFSRLFYLPDYTGYVRNFEMKGWSHTALDSADIIHNRIATVVGSRCR